MSVSSAMPVSGGCGGVGRSNRQIGELLGLTEGTVKIHVTAVFKALGVNSRTQALVTVARYGIDFGNVF